MTEIQGLIEREAEEKIKKWLDQNYLVALIGARQTGKTTLLQKIAQEKESKIPYFYYNFDDLLLRNKVASDFYFLKKDLEARLGRQIARLEKEILLIIDEAQKEPSVFELLKIFHDELGDKIKIIISGSASLEIQKKTTESLAGRAQYVYLFPLTIGEILKDKFNFSSESLFNYLFAKKLSWEFLQKQQALLYPYVDQCETLLSQILVFGLLPGVWQRKLEEKMAYLRSIVLLYLEKDIRTAGPVKELENFQNLLEILSFQVGGNLNLSNLSGQTQVSVNTLRSYRSILKNTFVLNFLPPFIQTPQKRIVKNPKAYFYDIGVANFLAGREKIENVLDSKASGGIFENIIIKSFEAFAKNEVLPIKTFFWRDYQGREIDLILKKETKIIPIEITNSKNIEQRKINNLSYFFNLYPQTDYGLVIYTGELKRITCSGKSVFCLPWWMWW